MVSSDDVKGKKEVQIELGSGSPSNGYEVKDQILPHNSTSEKGILGQENPRKSFLNALTILPSRVGFLKSSSSQSLASPSAKFRHIAEEKDEVSRSVPSSTSHGFRDNFSIDFVQKIDWVSLRKICKEWIKNPMNMVLLLWITSVAISGAILFFVMTGMLNSALPKKSQRDAWFEVNNQILNALFTLMCLYQHPKRFYHLVLLCRWSSKDISRLRKIYCKNGTYKPHEWAHMMVVVILLHVNCFAQYALCGLNLGYKRSERPALGVGLCLAVAIAAPAIAGIYTIKSPLGRDYECEMDQEAQEQIINAPNYLRRRSLEKRFSFASRDEQIAFENTPEWRGGLFDLWDDISVAYLSLFCTFCVFGWNMERLGFGNMYVHIATFLLLCVAPFWIFNLAAVNIDNEVIREALGITGVLLCIFGLLYGGFWRIQMRKRYKLPSSDYCCGNPAVTDCSQWLCCCFCSLSQEVRTVNFYNIVEDKFCRKEIDESLKPILSPLPREDGLVQLRSNPNSPLWGSSSPFKIQMMKSPSPDGNLPIVEEESSTKHKDGTMTPPGPSLIRREDNQTPPI